MIPFNHLELAIHLFEPDHALGFIDKTSYRDSSPSACTPLYPTQIAYRMHGAWGLQR
jgi:hypothetical protein